MRLRYLSWNTREARARARIEARGGWSEGKRRNYRCCDIISVSKIYGGMSFVRLCHHYFYFCRHLFHHQDNTKRVDSYNALHFICDFGSSALMYLFFRFFALSLSLAPSIYLYVYLFSTNLLVDKAYPLCALSLISIHCRNSKFSPTDDYTTMYTRKRETVQRWWKREREAAKKNKRNQFRLFAFRCWSAWRSFRFDAFEQKQVNFFPLYSQPFLFR